MALDLASCRSGRDGDLDARERWRCGFSEAAKSLRRPWRLACFWPGRRNRIVVDVGGSSPDGSIIDQTSTGTVRCLVSDEEE